jgi:putative DNA primase/helicase
MSATHDGDIIVHSFSGDDPIECKDYVRQRLGLPPFMPRKRKGNGKDRETYDYVDEAGNLLFQVVRYEPKSFAQRKPDGKGGWDWKLGNVRRVLFELPRVVEAVAAENPIFIVEGERKVELLRSWNVAATCNPGGSGKWRPEFSETLRGADVILMPDQDDPGWEHINQVGASLVGVAKRIRVLVLRGLRPKGDIVNWAKAGGDREQLDTLVAGALDWELPQATTPAQSEAKTRATERENELIAALAQKEPGIEYARERKKLAREFDVTIPDIEAEVKAYRENVSVSPLYGHWVTEPWPEPVDGDCLLRDTIKRIQRHVVINDLDALAIALWIMMAWVHEEIAVHSPILNINSAEPESGKSTVLGLLSFLMPRCIATVEISEGALYRAIERWKPSFAVDEFDSVLADDSKQSLRSVINSGHTRGQGVLRCEGDDHTPEVFSTFAPKAVAMVGRKMPSATLSRCIFVELSRRRKDEPVEKFKHVDDTGLEDLRRRLRRWSMDNEETLRGANPSMPEELVNRRGDNWQLQLAIADLWNGVEDFGDRARAAALRIEGKSDSRTANVRALAATKMVLDEVKDDAIMSADLIQRMTADPDSEWVEWGKTGKPISQKQLANLLKRYGIAPGQVRINGVQGRGYLRAHFIEAWERWL